MQRILSFLLVCVFLSTPVPARPAQANVEFLCSEVSQIPTLECEALVALYNSTNGPTWVNSTNWLVSLTPGDWYGVTVDVSGHVTELDLNNNGLSGSLPLELGSLPSLVYLYLNGNQLVGSIPPELGSLSNLVNLDLSGNQLSNPIPPEFGTLSSLEHLYLNGNQLSGDIPPQLGNLTHLSRLYLFDNLLTGSIPPELGSLTHMWNLWLSGNQLSGPIPGELSQLSGMVYLRLADNQLSGAIPVQLSALTGLWQLSLGNNLLSGEIPPELGGMTNLMILSLAGNQLTGSIPPELGALTNLYELDLSSNQLEGAIPTELGLLTGMEFLLLDQNQLSGDIPPELGLLTELELLHLNQNQLTGDIPESFTALTALALPGTVDGSYGLDLDYNWLNVPQDYPNPDNPLQLFLSQHDPDWNTRQAFEQVIGSAGGEFTSLDGRAHFVIPANALTEDTTFTFIPLPALNHDPGELAYANHSFQLTAEDADGFPVTAFDQPLAVTLAYTDADILTINEDSLALYYWDSGGLSWLDAITTCESVTYSREPLNNTFSLSLCHLSEFAVFGAPLQYNFLPFVVR